jgi:hypothetical protein
MPTPLDRKDRAARISRLLEGLRVQTKELHRMTTAERERRQHRVAKVNTPNARRRKA